MRGGIGGILIRLLILSFVVGFILNVLDLDPGSLLRNIGGTVESIFMTVVDAVRWAVPHILIGAIVVVPIWLVFYLLRYARGRH
ncbi:MAG: DUF6460 domain-containing protein [Proteobacteria bacterium]|nr:DUF6460 domain-containing protein [Pseudomonadota bacterium]